MESEAGDGEWEAAKRAGSYPRDLLRRLSGISSQDEHPEAGGGDSDEIELSLGLSLNGSFGVDPKGTKLVRSSSIASLTMLPRDLEFPVATPLARTCSLPAGNEEEHRKRKELQSLKRLEAKRKRSVKVNSRTGATPENGEGAQARSLPATLKAGMFKIELGGSSGFHGSTQFGGAVNGVSPPGLPVWAAGPVHRPVDVPGCLPQGSLGSQGSNSSSVSEFESRPRQGFDLSGFSSCTEAKSPAMVQSLPEHASYKTTAAAPSVSMVGRAGGGEEHALRRNSVGEMERNMMEEMPCVSTKGEGPNGRRIEGFLYRYKKGEELKIVCVCHGNFLTPAEFVKHAGGGDVAYPLKHIVVNPTPAAFL